MATECTVGNLVLWGRTNRAVKRDFWMYINSYTTPNENFEYGYPHSNAILPFHLKLECCKQHKATRPGPLADSHEIKGFL